MSVETRHEVNCRGCGAAIVWILGPDGKHYACEPVVRRFLTEPGGVWQNGREPHAEHCTAGKNGERCHA